MRERLCRSVFFLGRYRIDPSRRVAYRSSNTCVIFASDMRELSRPMPVVLKMVRDCAVFQRETAMLALCAEQAAVVGCVRAHSEIGAAGTAHLLQLELGAAAAFEHCLVLPRGDRTLSDVIVHDNVAGNPDEIGAVRSTMGQLASGLAHIHTVCGAIHSDFKPMNAVQFGAAWKLIDLDVAVSLGSPIQHSAKRCTLVAPPELLHEANRSVLIRDGGGGASAQLLASASYDAWSFGSVLFHLLSGSSLFHANRSDNLEAEELLALCRWTPSDCARRLARLKSTTIRGRQGEALVEWLLQKDADHRPSMSQVVQHAFLQDDPCHSLLACSLMPATARCAHQRHPQRQLRLHCTSDCSADAAAFVNTLKDWCPVLAKSTVLEVLGNHLLSEAASFIGVGVSETPACRPPPAVLAMPEPARYRGTFSTDGVVVTIAKDRKPRHQPPERQGKATVFVERRIRALAGLIDSVSKEYPVHFQGCIVRAVGSFQETRFLGSAGIASANLPTTMIKEEDGAGGESRLVSPTLQAAEYKSVRQLVEKFEQILQDCAVTGKAIITHSDGQVRPFHAAG